MLNRIFCRSVVVLFCSSLLIFFSKCNLKSKKIDACKSNYTSAAKALNDYYRDSGQYHLQSALQSVEGSMECVETKNKAVDLKISLLMLLKKYKSGYEFIDSLNENDFAVRYQKSMYYKYFKAMEYESRADTVARNELLREIISEVQDYIQHEDNPEGKVDEKTYYDLLLMKTRLSGIEQIKPEIDSLKVKYPQEQTFFDGMENTLQELPQ